MTEVSTWQLITFFITLSLTLVGMFVGAGKMLMSQFNERLTKQLDALEHRIVDSKKDIAAAKEIAERALTQAQTLRIHIAENYQNRDDAIRTDTANMARYDAINAKLDQVIMKAGIKE